MATEDEKKLDQTLRPRFINEFSGQNRITENLNVFVSAAKKRKESLDHVLLTGPPGLGKTTLAHIIANELGTKLKITSGPVLEKPGDLAGLLTNLEEHSVLFIDEIHRLSPVIEEYLYSAMEDYKLDIMIESGPNARTVQISLPKYTLVGATTRAGMLTSPLRDRFGIKFRLDYYDSETLDKIISRSAKILNLKIDKDASIEIAKRSRGTPRIANRLLRRTRDFADFENKKSIDIEVSKKALLALEVDKFGLDEMDKNIILTIIDKYNGGPVGLSTLSVAVNEDPGTIEEVYEPFLIQQGFIQRTPRGREATTIAYNSFGKNKFTKNNQSLFE
jgi:Holliday junction DNA helicase RuvB